MFSRIFLKVICLFLLVIIAVTTPLYSASDDYLKFENAISNDDLNVIQTLISSGVYVDARNDNNGATPLRQAAINNSNPEIIRTLIEAGADVNARDNDGRTPFMAAAWHVDNLNSI